MKKYKINFDPNLYNLSVPQTYYLTTLFNKIDELKEASEKDKDGINDLYKNNIESTIIRMLDSRLMLDYIDKVENSDKDILFYIEELVYWMLYCSCIEEDREAFISSIDKYSKKFKQKLLTTDNHERFFYMILNICISVNVKIIIDFCDHIVYTLGISDNEKSSVFTELLTNALFPINTINVLHDDNSNGGVASIYKFKTSDGTDSSLKEDPIHLMYKFYEGERESPRL